MRNTFLMMIFFLLSITGTKITRLKSMGLKNTKNDSLSTSYPEDVTSRMNLTRGDACKVDMVMVGRINVPWRVFMWFLIVCVFFFFLKKACWDKMGYTMLNDYQASMRSRTVPINNSNGNGNLNHNSYNHDDDDNNNNKIKDNFPATCHYNHEIVQNNKYHVECGQPTSISSIVVN